MRLSLVWEQRSFLAKPPKLNKESNQLASAQGLEMLFNVYKLGHFFRERRNPPKPNGNKRGVTQGRGGGGSFSRPT